MDTLERELRALEAEEELAEEGSIRKMARIQGWVMGWIE
jgi:hypothetical protein